jgi:hypothetical protein
MGLPSFLRWRDVFYFRGIRVFVGFFDSTELLVDRDHHFLDVGESPVQLVHSCGQPLFNTVGDGLVVSILHVVKYR